MSDPPHQYQMVNWYDPRQLVKTGVRALLASIFGAYADPREMQTAQRPFDEEKLDPAYDYRDEDDLWIDFVADLGDGWNSTATIAHLLAQDSLCLGERALPRGRILVMGGDQVYPDASRDDYRNRLIAPFRTALPECSVEPEPHLYAIPGNHDWYDGLQSFLAIFGSRRPATKTLPERPGRPVGGWRTRQTRSHFALALPRDWWLWGIDMQLSDYIDRGQLDYFELVADRFMEPGSQVILCTPQPGWTLSLWRGAAATRNLAFLRHLLESRGHHLRVVLSGDFHHYSRYEAEDGVQLITAGGGGAFLHPTHFLPDRIEVPYSPDAERETETVRLAARFPDADTSRALGWRNLMFPWENYRFVVAAGCIALLLAWLIGTAPGEGGSVLGAVLDRPSAVVLLAAITAGLVAFAEAVSRREKLLLGVGHAVVQIGAMLLLIAALLPLPGLVGLTGPPATLVVLVLAGVLGGLLSAAILGAYLAIGISVLGQCVNTGFSSLHVEDYKNFLRLHVRGDGRLEIHPVGVRRVPRKWSFRRCQGEHDWLAEPGEPIKPELIEPPITVERG